MHSHIWTLILFLIIVQYNPLAYNINPHNVEIFSDPVPAGRGSYFGYSVALYANAKSSLILVGAPRANSTGLPSIKEPGTVFKCPVNDTCKEWMFDKSENGPRSRDKVINQIKDNAWIGATIAIENKTEARVVVCGARWINNIVHRYRHNWYMNGICYWTLATDATAFERKAENELLPLTDSLNQVISKGGIGFYNYGMGQVGFSLHMNSQGDNLNLIQGSPGVYNWKGDVILTTINTNITAMIDNSFSRTVIPLLAKEERVPGNSYFGYAVTSGSYFDKRNICYAAGAPKGGNIQGQVLVFNFPSISNQRLFVKTTVHGQQYGEYFGAALTSCDINNDQRHELIVGAPQWSKDEDEGRIYIFTARRNDNFEKLQTIEGEIIGGRFGTVVTCLGDIDHDGYNDIAVGAPYEQKDGGAVYIFNGNRDGVRNKYSQRLFGSQFSSDMRGFGISISEPRDIDNDNHSDIAIGAYLSDKVVLLRSVPVVTVNVTLAYLEKLKLLKNTTSFVIDLYVSYEGIYVPENLQIIKILKIDQLHNRATYQRQQSNDKTYILPDTLHKSVLSHTPLKIHLMNDIQNVIDPIEISVSIHIKDDLYTRNKNSTKEFCTSCVAINRFLSNTEDRIKLPFAVDCGEDNVCVSDLGVILSVDNNSNLGNRYIIGSTPTITIHIDTYNRGEPAYQTRVHVCTGILSLASIPPECTEISHMNAAPEIICDIGNPLRTNKTLMLQLDMSMIRYDVKEVELWANITTQSDEMNPADNSHVTTIYFDVDMDIAIGGKAQESSYSYLHEDTEKPINSLRFQHFYEIQGFGVSPIEEAMLIVKIPILWRHSTGDIVILNINDTLGRMDGYQFYCNNVNKNEVFFTSNIAESQVTESTGNGIMLSSTNTDNTTHTKFNIEKSILKSVPSENRTLYINCTNTAVQCIEIDCKLGPFINSLSVAKLWITLDLQLSNFYDDLMKNKDIIFIISEGSVIITQPRNITQKVDHKPDTTFIATTFLGSPLTQQIAVWIIALSVFLGFILLILLILGLIKIGFFNRKKKVELEALKAESNKKYSVAMEMSSTEALDQE